VDVDVRERRFAVDQVLREVHDTDGQHVRCPDCDVIREQFAELLDGIVVR
jgi:hypothetical protein